MDWIEGQINNEDIFPTRTGETIEYEQVIKKLGFVVVKVRLRGPFKSS